MRFINFYTSLVLAIVLALGGVASSVRADSFTLLHQFTGGANGLAPTGGLIESDSVLYGVTRNGGSDFGLIYSINPDGSNYTVVRAFSTISGQGYTPTGSLLLYNDKFYGMTNRGGANNQGTIYSVNKDGTGYTTLHSFSTDLTNGKRPSNGSLIYHQGKFYGMTSQGGSDDLGVIFSIDTDGNNFSLLHSFTGNIVDGSAPPASLIIDGSTLYGMTPDGGASNQGVVFSIETSGANYTVLHSFTENNYPSGALILHENQLYGTSGGGANDAGMIFRINKDGTGYQDIYDFTGGTGGGGVNNNGLVFDTDTAKFYGLGGGGDNSKGILYSIEPDGDNYTILHHFSADSTEGTSAVFNQLMISNYYVYGPVNAGGIGGGGGYGTIVKYQIGTPPSPTPTPTPSGGDTSVVVTATNKSADIICSTIPSDSADLFQIDSTDNSATLFYTPVKDIANYLVSYGFDQNANQFNVFTNQGYSSGVLTYTVNHLPKNSQIYFKVLAQNNCGQGTTSNTLKINTTNQKYYKNGPTPTPITGRSLTLNTSFSPEPLPSSTPTVTPTPTLSPPLSTAVVTPQPTPVAKSKTCFWFICW